MKRIIVQLFVLVCALCMASAWVAHSPPSDDCPGKCCYQDEKYDAGTHYPENTCVELSCSEDFFLNIKGCGKYIPPPGYKNVIGTNASKKYPDCCKNFVKV